VAPKPQTAPFANLPTAAAGGGGPRQYIVDAPTNPSIVAASWVMMPGKK